MQMQKLIDRCNDLLERFDSKNVLPGVHWHTPTREDFVELTAIVKKLVETLQHDGEEID